MPNEDSPTSAGSEKDPPQEPARSATPAGPAGEQRRRSYSRSSSTRAEAGQSPRKVARKRPSAFGETERSLSSLQNPQKATVSRRLEMQHAVLILGTLFLFGFTFYVGKNYDRFKYMIRSRIKPEPEKMPDLFPGVAADDLVKQALIAERDGHWQDAVERLMSAKQKDLRYRGLFLRLGKIFYAHGDYASAGKAFERAISFGEDVGEAWQYRGYIAGRQGDLTTAAHYFEEASRAEPLAADNFYFWGEVLRMDQQPKPAIAHYEEALLRAHRQQDADVCALKIRLAQMEAAESNKIDKALAEKQTAGPLSIDWLMTAAALRIREGQINQAAVFVQQARDAKSPGFFISCANDMTFREAAKKFPELRELLKVDGPEMNFPDR